LALPSLHASTYRLASPDARLTSIIEVGDSLTFTLNSGDKEVIAPSTIMMKLNDNNNLGEKMSVKKAFTASHLDTIPSPFYKKSNVVDCYNALTLTAKRGYTVEFRMYNDGLAYRFVSTKQKEATVINEVARYRFAENFSALVPYVRDRKKSKNATIEQQLWNDMQNRYTPTTITELDPKRMVFTPILLDIGEGEKLCIAEADVENYPGMYLLGDSAKTSLQGKFAPYPTRVEQGGHNNVELLVKERAPYIAKVNGARTYPWRTFIVTHNDCELPECDMIYRLAAPSRVADTSWIKPGKVAWDWWNAWGIYGVDFKAGINTDTYKYYIDFAAKYGLEYVILDEGWATNGKCDLFDVVPDIDMDAIIAYANSRNVGIILWAGYYAMERNLEEVVSRYAQAGVKGFKIDFLDRDDQVMIDFMYRTAEICARHKMLVDFHGCPKPTGLQRTYPNVINYEAVFGMEQLKWSKPDVDMVTYDVTLPFIRMVAGPMDYTPGAMRNSVKGEYFPDRNNPMSQGTRCRQLAEYVIFDHPLAMLCDSPTRYMDEDECTQFIADIPTVWDETRVLAGSVGKYIVEARRLGERWYLAAMGNWDTHDITVTLPEQMRDKTLSAFADGINADRTACDYRHIDIHVPADGIVTLHLAPGGGFAAKM
jgi:alpha-glucosidase